MSVVTFPCKLLIFLDILSLDWLQDAFLQKGFAFVCEKSGESHFNLNSQPKVFADRKAVRVAWLADLYVDWLVATKFQGSFLPRFTEVSYILSSPSLAILDF